MKKIFLITIILLSTIYAKNNIDKKVKEPGNGNFSAGVYVGLDSGVTVKIGRFPVIGVEFYGYSQSLNVTLDIWIINNIISDTPLSWYLGAGVFTKFDIFDTWGITQSGVDMSAGFRVPVGLQFFIPKIKQLEVFVEVAPGLEIIRNPNVYINTIAGARWHF